MPALPVPTQSSRSFDELWGYTSERSHRLWDEMIPPPTRKVACRLTTTYAGFEGESDLLEGLYKRGLHQPLVGTRSLCRRRHADVLVAHADSALADAEWVEQMRRQLRPHAFARMIENRFAHSEETFIDMTIWDACCTGQPVPGRRQPVRVGRRRRFSQARQDRHRRGHVGSPGQEGAHGHPSHLHPDARRTRSTSRPTSRRRSST